MAPIQFKAQDQETPTRPHGKREASTALVDNARNAKKLASHSISHPPETRQFGHAALHARVPFLGRKEKGYTRVAQGT